MVFFFEFTTLMRGRKYGYLNFAFFHRSATSFIVPRFSIALHYYIKIVDYIGHVAFAINRFSAFYSPTLYEQARHPQQIQFALVFTSLTACIHLNTLHQNLVKRIMDIVEERRREQI
ncbi:unnamed protein product [Toxocara canis]|uniref:Uncharacterized protein n=1 Tax=Toxocara canis TaxID=6265 RepID=A0A183V9F9_TOXCA|nr:unnamed protein product [Toxocara canis]